VKKPEGPRSETFEVSLGEEIEMSKKVYVDQDECIGCGSCEEICPEVFKLNADTEKAEVIKPEGGPEDLIQEAVDTCPVSCIHWEE
jgi:ferredoxin